jgi:hypothetical protein
MILKEVTDLISSVGFPIAITVYLLVAQNKVIVENTKAVRELIIYLKNR